MFIIVLQHGATSTTYRLERLIGEGGHGRVYAGRDPLGTQVAVKALNPGVSIETKAAARLVEEGQLLAQINHPNVVRSLDAGIYQGQLYLVMEYVPGHTLRTCLTLAGKRPPLPDLVRWIWQVCDGLAEAHRLCIVHRDVKPDNVIIITPGGHAKLIDFGYAKSLVSSELKTTTGKLLVGTSLYMAPEQLTGGPPDPSWDVFSTGLVLYEVITGKNPMGTPEDTIPQLLDRHFCHRPPRLSRVAPNVPSDVADLVDRAMDNEAGKRPSMGELSKGLRDALHWLDADRRRRVADVRLPGRPATRLPTEPMPQVPNAAPCGVSPQPQASSSLARLIATESTHAALPSMPHGPRGNGLKWEQPRGRCASRPLAETLMEPEHADSISTVARRFEVVRAPIRTDGDSSRVTGAPNVTMERTVPPAPKRHRGAGAIVPLVGFAALVAAGGLWLGVRAYTNLPVSLRGGAAAGAPAVSGSARAVPLAPTSGIVPFPPSPLPTVSGVPRPPLSPGKPSR